MVTRRVEQADVSVGNRIRQQRLLKEMSQTKLGELIGVTFQQVQKYEKGSNRVGASRLAKIAEVLKIPISDLFGEDGGTLEPNERRKLDPFLSNRNGISIAQKFPLLSPELQTLLRDLISALAEASAANSSPRSSINPSKRARDEARSSKVKPRKASQHSASALS